MHPLDRLFLPSGHSSEGRAGAISLARCRAGHPPSRESTDNKEAPGRNPGLCSQKRNRSLLSASCASPTRRAPSPRCPRMLARAWRNWRRRRRTVSGSSDPPGQSGRDLSLAGAEQDIRRELREHSQGKSPGQKPGALQAFTYQPLLNVGQSCARSRQGALEGLQRSR